MVDAPSKPRRRWFRNALIWTALLGGIWWIAATATVRWRFVAKDGAGTKIINSLGIVWYLHQTRMVPIDDPRPPTRSEIALRGVLGTGAALIAWLYLRSAAKRDRGATRDRKRKTSE
jgi:hypothetical protein